MEHINVNLNFFTFLITFFRFEANQTKGNDLNMKKDVNGYWSIFFLLIYFIGKILLLNMFIGIIIENIIVNKQKACKKYL